LAATWRFDLSQDADGVTRLNGDTPYLIYRDQPTVPATTNDSPVACFDAKREGAWHFSRTQSANRGLSFTHKSGRVDNFAAPALNLVSWASMHHMPDDDLLCVICDEPKFSQNRFGVVKLLRMDALPGGEWVTILPTVPDDEAMRWNLGLPPGGIFDMWASATHGDPNPVAIQAGYTGAQWSTLLGSFVAMDYKTGTRVWKLTPPPPGQRFTGTWAWTVETVTSADGSTMDVRNDSASQNGAFGKLVECPALKSLVWTRRVDKPGQLIRLRGM
jgi:hypothetical protein